MTTTTIYPTDYTCTYRSSANQTWANLIAGAGTANWDSYTSDMFINVESGANNNTFQLVSRCIMTFTTAAIPNQNYIQSATFQVCASDDYTWRYDCGDYTIGLTGGTPASYTSLANSDHQLCNSTVLSATRHTSSDFSYWTYCSYTLNSDGIQALSNFGYCAIYMRCTPDIDGTPTPTYSSGDDSQFCWASAGESGTTYDPKVVVIHDKLPRPCGALGSSNAMMY